MNDKINDQEIHAYLDKQLSDEQRKSFEQRLVNDPSAQKKLAEYQKIEDSLQALYQPVLDEPTPDNLSHLHSRQTPTYYTAIAASFVFFAVGLVLGWQINQTDFSDQNDSMVMDLKSPALFAHTVYSVEKIHPVEVHADQKQHMNHWLSKRLKTTLKAPDLSQHQFDLIGGRLLPSTKERMAAQYMYQSKNGERITLYVKRGNWQAEETSISHTSKSMQSDSFNLSYWIDGDLGYVLTGQVDRQINQKLAESIYQQMSLNENWVASLF